SAIVYSGAGSGLLNSPYLPNGQPNPFVSSSGIPQSNWYLPSTWSSPTMNWHGVQPNGYMPSTSSTYTGYNPSTFTASQGSGSVANNYSQPTYHQNYTIT